MSYRFKASETFWRNFYRVGIGVFVPVAVGLAVWVAVGVCVGEGVLRFVGSRRGVRSAGR